MTERVDFYILNTAAAKQRWMFACRLTEKAYVRDLSVVIVNATRSDAQALDELLWTFSDRSFVPHALMLDTPAADGAAPVRLTLDPATLPAADLLVNLADRLPAELERYARIAEIVDADPERRRLGRERFKTYRDLKLTLETHQIEGDAEPDG